MCKYLGVGLDKIVVNVVLNLAIGDSKFGSYLEVRTF